MLATNAGLSQTLAKDKTKADVDADVIVTEQCIEPLRKAAAREVPTMAISSEFAVD
jgi:hypothetical protein